MPRLPAPHSVLRPPARTRSRRMRRASASSTRNSIPDGWPITSPRAGTRPASVNTSPPTVSMSACALVLGQHRAHPRLERLDRQPRIHVERAVGALGHHRHLILVVLVGDVADDRFDQVLDRHQPVDAAVLVDHQRQMHARLAHLQQQIEHRHLRRHHQRPAQDRLQRERLRPADIGEHVLDVDHADDVIELLAVHRQARVALAADLLRAPARSVTSTRIATMSARGTITSSAVVPRSRSTLAISARSWRSSSGIAPGVCGASAASCTSSAIESRTLCSTARRRRRPRNGSGAATGAAIAAAHARFHGLGTPSRRRMRASAISIRRASPARAWSWPRRCSAPCTTRCAR